MRPKEKILLENFTYADYLKWNDGKRYEIIEGQIYNMSPAPIRIHQSISRNLSYIIQHYLKEKTCEVYSAPFDVRFAFKAGMNDMITNVVQPDISVICDPKKLDKAGCIGPPDWIIEILSPSTAKKDITVILRLRYF